MNRNSIIIFLVFIIPLMMYYFLNTSQAKNQVPPEQTNLPQIIKFYSPMCMDCQRIDKSIKNVYPKYSERIYYNNISTQERNDETVKLIKKYNVKLVPTTVFIDRNGKVLHRIEGYIESKELTEYMNELVK